MSDQFANHGSTLDSPPRHAEAVTPNDGADLPNFSRAIWVGVAGNVRVTTTGGKTVTYENAPVGYLIVCASRIHATGTTASSMLACW